MKTYIKFLGRNRLFAFIEAFGLAVSLCFTILIGNYAYKQHSIAYGCPDYDRIYSLSTEDMVALSWWDKEALDSEVPEVELATRYRWEESTAQAGESHFSIHRTSLDKEFFTMFPFFGIDEGSIGAIEDKGSILVSRSFANMISSSGEDVLGRRITCDDQEYTVAGIFEDFKDSIFPYCDIIDNIENLDPMYYGDRKFGVIGNVMTLFKTREGVSREEITDKTAALCRKNYSEDWIRPVLHRLDELYFLSDAYTLKHTDKAMLGILTAVAVALLLSAMFNYINLSAALTGKRAKEMAIRRLIGADRTGLFCSGILESVAFTALCLIAGLLLAIALTPMMNSLLVGEDAAMFSPLEIRLSAGSLSVYCLLILVLGCIAGLIPARMASRFSPVDTIKGSFRRRSKMLFSKIFIIIQSTIAMILLSIGLLMELQMKHLMSLPMHAQTERLYWLNAFFRDASSASVLADRMKSIPDIKQIGMGNAVPGHFNMGIGIKDETGKSLTVQLMICDSTFFRLLHPEVTENFGHPLGRSLWLGETTAKALNLTDSTEAYYRRIFSGINNTKIESIGGIVKDIPVSGALSEDQNPYMAITVQRPEDLRYACGLLMQTTDESAGTAREIDSAFRKYQEEAYDYDEPDCNGFISANIYKELAPARRTMRLVETFMILSIIISLMGLVAMSIWYSDQKSKEIAVRKVFGGTVESETLSSVLSYLILTLISCIIGVPAAVFLASRYLERFAYRVSGYWWIFAATVIISLGISFLSVLWQTLRAARTNPATELKKE